MSRGIVTLCGSVRFKDEFVQANRELTLAGWIVLAPGVFEHDWLHKPENNAELRKDGLDKLHCEKIDLSDSILILNKDGYIGKSTQREYEYAIDHDKIVFWLNPPEFESGGIGRSYKEMIIDAKPEEKP